MSTVPPKDYSPSVVASSFIKQYYEMMTKSPENLHKFYNTDSYFMHSDLTHQTGVSATGPEHIRSAMGALNLKYTKVDLTNGYIDAQKSANNGVFVLVVGTLAPPDAADKPFVQTFLLSNQGSSAYYVSNSVFRLLIPPEEQDSAPAQAAAPAAVTIPAAEMPTFTVEAAQDQSAALAAAAASAESAAERASELEAVEALLQEAASEPEAGSPAAEAEPVHVAAPAAVAVAPQVAAAPAAPVDPNRKLNYSDIVRKANTGAAPAAAPAHVAAHHAPAPAAAPVAAPKPAPTAASAGHSVYIKQLAEATTVAEIQALFAQFGNILSVEQAAGRAFAFVKFETNAAMQAAVAGAAGGKLSLHGQALRVEERNSTRPVNAASSSSGATGGAGTSSGASGGRNRGDRGGRDRERERGGEKSGGDRDRGDRGANRTSGGDGKGRGAAGNGGRAASGSKSGPAGKSGN